MEGPSEETAIKVIEVKAMARKLRQEAEVLDDWLTAWAILFNGVDRIERSPSPETDPLARVA